MYQIIIGKANFDGSPVTKYFHKFIEGESTTMEELSGGIIEGLQQNLDLMIDSNIITALIQSPMVTAYDLRSLQYYLMEQKIVLLVTRVNSDVISDSSNMMIKVVTPMTDQFGIPKAIDYPFVDKVDVAEVVKSISTSYDLFNSGIFINSPISELLAQLPSLSDAGLPDTELVTESLNILKDLGFSMYPIFFNE